MGWQQVDETADGFGWLEDRGARRTSHALLVDGRVWLIDPVDGPGLEERIRALGPPGGVLQLLDRHRRDGHGAGVHVDASAAVCKAIATARRRLPRAWLGAASAVRAGRAASR